MGLVFRWIKALFKSEVALGQRVHRAAATLPQTTAHALFTITGGRVLVTSIIGRVTTVIQTQANDTKLVGTPTTGTAADLCAVLNISADAEGDLYGITGIPGDAMIGASGNVQGMTVKGVVLQPGTLDLDCAASNSGEVEWTLHYVPIDPGAVVVAA